MAVQPTYRFRHINIDLRQYADNMRFRSNKLRQEAADLILRAQAIDEERDRLEQDLVEVATLEDRPDAE